MPRFPAAPPLAMVVGLGSCVLPAFAADEPDQAVLMFSVGAGSEVVDVIGKGPWKPLKKGGDAPAVPSNNWVAYRWHSGLFSDFFALKTGVKLLNGAQIVGGSRGSPVWYQIEANNYKPLQTNYDAVVMCAPPADASTSPDVAECLQPASMDGVFAPGGQRGPWSVILNILQGRNQQPSLILAGGQRESALAALETARRTALEATAKAQAEQQQKQQEDYERDQRQKALAVQEFDAAPKGKAMVCDTGSLVLLEGFSLGETAVFCRMSNAYRLSRSVNEMLAAGWGIENQVTTPITSAIGRKGFSLNIVFRKR